MSFVLSGLSSLFGLLSGGAQLGAVQAAGQAQERQASRLLRQNAGLNRKTAQELAQASGFSALLNAQAGRYQVIQNARTSLLGTQFKVAHQWTQILGG